MKQDLKKLEKIILNFKNQLLFQPKIIFFKKINYFKFKKIILVGMGGSHLAMDLIKILSLKKEIKIYSTYNILENDLKKDNLFILSSYSGMTEEVLNVFFKLKGKFELLIISQNGKLIELAKEYKINYLQLPKDDLMPRYALGYFLKAFLFIIDKKQIKLIEKIALKINYLKLKVLAKKIEREIKKEILIIYSSFRNLPLALHFKIKLNETNKLPVFINFLPEVNHNEIMSFTNLNFKKNVLILMLFDELEDKNEQKNFQILQKIFKKEKISFLVLKIKEKDNLRKIINNIILVDWLSYFLAKRQKISPLNISLIEEIKKIKKKYDKRTIN